jgi:hypothetical protein
MRLFYTATAEVPYLEHTYVDPKVVGLFNEDKKRIRLVPVGVERKPDSVNELATAIQHVCECLFRLHELGYLLPLRCVLDQHNRMLRCMVPDRQRECLPPGRALPLDLLPPLKVGSCWTSPSLGALRSTCIKWACCWQTTPPPPPRSQSSRFVITYYARVLPLS